MTLSVRDRIIQNMLDKQPMVVPGPPGTDGTNGRDGVNGENGKAGLNGTDGKDGRDGVDGKPGRPGKNGQDGRDGSSFRVGSGPPPMSIPAGDTYLDLDTLDLYVIE